jgi:hypothetical protein
MTAERSLAVSSRSGAHHQSSIETILDGCSWQYYLANVRNIPTNPKPHALIGTNFHSAIEIHEVARMNGKTLPTLAEMLELAEESIRKEADLVPAEMMIGKDGETWTAEDLVSMCHNAINNWYSEPASDGESNREWMLKLQPLAIEPYFKLELVEDADPIGGWIDGVYQDEQGKIYLVDQKTAGDFSRWPLDGKGHRFQATMYGTALVLSEDFPQVQNLDDIQMHYVISRTKTGTSRMEKARRVVVQPELDDVAMLGDRIRQVEAVIKHKLYAPNPTWNLCSPKYCPFYNGCQVTGELRKPDAEFIARYRD